MRYRLREVSSKVLPKRFLFDGHEPSAYRPDARSRWRGLLLQCASGLTEVRLKRIDVDQASHRCVIARFGDDHPAPAMADEHAWTRALQDDTSGRDIGIERRQRVLHDIHRVAVTLEDLRNRFPARAIGEGAVNQDYILYSSITQGGHGDRKYSKRKG